MTSEPGARRVRITKSIMRAVRSFPSGSDGNVGIIFGLASLPLLAFAGTAVDYGLAVRQQVKLQAATDATALLLCQTPLSTTTAQLQTQASTAMAGFAASASLVVDPLTVTSNPRQISMATHLNSATFFASFTSVSTPRVTATAQCTTPLPKTFEIALALDTTGSMGNSSNGQTKLQALQQAATSFVNYVHTNSSFTSDTKMSIVPFAASVAVNPTTYSAASWVDTTGKSAYHWANVTSPASAGFKSRFDLFAALKNVNSKWGWGGCFEKLPYPLNVQDVSPVSSNANSYYIPLFAPDEPGNGTTGIGTSGSGSSTISYNDVNSYIDDYSTSSSCAASSSMSALQLESRACKYLNINASHAYYTTAAYGSSGSVSIGQNGPNFGCNSQPLQRLTSDVPTLTTLINSFTSAGTTDIHEGLSWAWRTISPNSVFADGVPYSTTTVNKIVILMTDGSNEWLINGASEMGSIYNDLGFLKNGDGSNTNSKFPAAQQNVASQTSARNALDALTSETCTNIKAAGISIFTIGFSIPSDPIDQQGQTLLQNCASSAGQAFVANDSNGLISDFNAIAKSIGALRLSK